MKTNRQLVHLMTYKYQAATEIKANFLLLLLQMNFIGSDLGKLHEVFDPAILPEELGGDLPPGDILAKVREYLKKVK